MAWYLLFCFSLFMVLTLIDIYEDINLDLNDALVNFFFSFVPLVNFYTALKLIYLGFESLFCKVVDSLWFSKIWDKD